MNDKPTHHVNVSFGVIVKTVILLISLVIGYILKDLVLAVFTSIVLASAIEPGTRWFMRRKIPRVAGIIAIYICVMSVFASIIFYVVPSALVDLAKILNSVPKYITTADVWKTLHLQSIKPLLTDVPKTLPLSDIVSAVSAPFIDLSGGFLDVLSGIFGGVAQVLLVVVLTFYFAVQPNGIANFLRVVTPVGKETYILDVWNRTQMRIGKWMQGQLLLCVIVAILIFLPLAIFRVEHALLFALLAFVFEIIPIFGMVLAALLAFIIQAPDAGLTSGLWIVAVFLGVQQFEAQLIYPLVVQKIVGIPPLLVIIALIAGGELAGFMGIILSIPVSVVLMEIFNDMRKQKDVFLTE